MTTVLHLALAADWEAAQTSGRYEGSTLGRTLAQEGFVHCSTPKQLPGVAGRFYADVTEPLVLLEVDVEALETAGSPVRWEHVPDADDPFPHVYGPITTAAVVDVSPYVVG